MASKWRKVHERFWRDEVVRTFNEGEKLTALYLFTGQANRVGIFGFSTGLAADDLGCKSAKFLRRMDHVCSKLEWIYDDSARVLFIPTWWKYNSPDNPAQFSGYLGDLADLPDSYLVPSFFGAKSFLSTDFVAILDHEWDTRYALRFPGMSRETSTQTSGPLGEERERRVEEEPPCPPAGGVQGRTQGQVRQERVNPTSTGSAAASAAGLPSTVPQEIVWRANAAWDAHVAAWREFRQRKDGVAPGPQAEQALPAAKHAAMPFIRSALLEFDRELLQPDQRERWERESVVRAAGIGMFHDSFLTGDDPRNEGRREWVEHWRPWRPQRGKPHPTPRFAELYFANVEKWQRRRGA